MESQDSPTHGFNLANSKWVSLFLALVRLEQVQVQDVYTILYFDCTKLGVLAQSEINMIGDVSEKVLGRNPTSGGLVFFSVMSCETNVCGFV